MRKDTGDAPGADWWWVGPAVGWLAAQFILTVLACVHTFLSTFSVASCTATSCDYAAFTASIHALYGGATALLIASSFAIFLLRKRGRVVIWPPIVGSAALIVLFVVTYVAGRAALTLPLFGNRLPE